MDLCQHCGKKKASVIVAQIQANNEKTVLHVCQDCAKKHYGYENTLSSGSFKLSTLLAGIIQEGAAADAQQLPQTKCPGCGLSYGEFRQQGRLGCSRCYETFFDHLKDLLRRIHGSNDHLGKVPRSSREKFIARRELNRLQQEIRRAVEREEFEKAAALRDHIRELEIQAAKEQRESKAK